MPDPKRRIIRSKDFIIEKEDEVKGPLLLLGYFGIFLLVTGVLVLLPLIMLIFYPEERSEYKAFLIPGASAFGLGCLLSLIIFRRKQGKLTPVQDLALLVGVWLLVILFSAFPYMFYGYGFTQSFFESCSGYTSTGLTILNWAKESITLDNGTTDVASHMLFFHRTMTQLVGGIGLVLVVSSAISEQSGLNIYLLEGHNDRLLPNLAKSARLIFSLYLGYIVVGSILYICVGVTPFDAFCHSVTAVATGGFSTKSGSINMLVNEVSVNGEWRGIIVEVITEVLMLLGGTNIVIHYSLLRGKVKVLRHFEFFVTLAVFIFIWPFVVTGMTQYYGGNIGAGFRYGTFGVISTLSTGGFQSVDSFQGHIQTADGFTAVSGVNANAILFPTYVMALLAICMNIGMQNGSTTGAIKQNRVALFAMSIWIRMKTAVGIPEERRVYTVYRFGQKTRVEKEEFTEATTFIGTYVLILLLGTSVISAILYGTHTMKQVDSETYYTWTDAFFEFSGCLSSGGLTSGITNNSTSLGILWVEMIGMLFGRLEIFVYFTLLGKMISQFRHRKHIYSENPKNRKRTIS